MEWRDTGLVIGARRFGENGLIVDAFTKDHGRQSGLVYGGASSKKRSGFEIGTTLELEWRARTADQLGHFNLSESIAMRSAAFMNSRLALTALQSVTALLNSALPEGQSYPALFDATELVLDQLTEADVWPALMVRWEVGFLQSVGYGLDFSKCAVSGERRGLTHVSPKTGRAVCGDAVPEFIAKLLPLPAFLTGSEGLPSDEDISEGFALTGYFIKNRLYAEAHMEPPGARDLMLRRLGDARVKASPSA